MGISQPGGTPAIATPRNSWRHLRRARDTRAVPSNRDAVFFLWLRPEPSELFISFLSVRPITCVYPRVAHVFGQAPGYRRLGIFRTSNCYSLSQRHHSRLPPPDGVPIAGQRAMGRGEFIFRFVENLCWGLGEIYLLICGKFIFRFGILEAIGRSGWVSCGGGLVARRRWPPLG